MSDNEYGIEDFFDKPYAKRQFVQFVPLEELDAAVAGESEDSAKGNSEMAIFIAAGGIVGAIAAVGAQMIGTKTNKKKSESDLSIFYVPFAEIDSFNLAPGHPQRGVLYAAHPSDRFTYLPTADFHRLTFEHKFSEAIQLLMHLGAETIKVNHESGWGRDFAARLSAGIPQAEGGAQAEASGSEHEKDQALYEAKLPGHTSPKLPDKLVWYPYQPTWKNIAEGRIDFGMEKFNLKLQYTEDYGINADLAVDLQKIGLGLGGSFEKHQKTVWTIEGTFKT